jgi:hypothetical protein
VGTPGFTSAGNLWLWIPQLRGTLETAGRVRVGVQGAVLAPMSSDATGLFDTDFDIAERSKRPTVQGRVRVRWGGDRAGGELGVGAHRGWFAAKGDSLIGGQMVSADARVHFTRFVELRGEAFDGKALRGLGGGGIGQSFGVNGVAVSTRGGWAQLNLIPSERVTVGFGSGVDDPTDVLVSTGGRLRNQASAGHLQLRPGGGIVLGAEWRRIWTRYASATRTNDHINVAVGFEW